MVQQRVSSRARRGEALSDDEIYLQAHEDQMSTVKSRSIGEQGEAQSFEHRTADLVVIYFPTSWGWESREVPSTNLRLVTHYGARVRCGDCGGNCSPDPMNPQYNNCTGREKFATRQCPECNRLVYDFGARAVNQDLLQPVNDARDSDANAIDDDAYKLSTPAARTKVLLDNHLRRYHMDAAQALGLPVDADRGIAGGGAIASGI